MDKEYWNQYYKKNFNNKEIINPSSFALFCQNNYYNASEKKSWNLVVVMGGILYTLPDKGTRFMQLIKVIQ